MNKTIIGVSGPDGDSSPRRPRPTFSKSVPCRVLIASEYAMVRDALELVIASQSTIAVDAVDVVGSAIDGRTAIAKSCDLLPDVVVLDATIAHAYGPNVTPHIRRHCPETQVLILDGFEEASYLKELFRLGLSGYVWERSPVSTFLQGLEMVACGKTYLDPALSLHTTNGRTDEQKESSEAEQMAAPPIADLSEREQAVLRRIVRGYANKEIAAQLNLSIKTVESYKTRAMGKLGMTRRVDMVTYAVRQGWFRTSL